MANRSKGDRRLTGVRIPVDLLAKIKIEAGQRGLGINAYLLLLIRLGRQSIPELRRENVRIPRQSA